MNDQPASLLAKLSQELTLLEREDLRSQLIVYVNHLLLHHFEQLIQLLYRVDVSEQKLRLLLSENPDKNAAAFIADELIQRQTEKVKIRSSFRADEDIPDDEKW